MALPNFTDQKIQDTYQRVVQKDENGQLFDGTGSLIPLKIDGPDLIVSGAVRAQSYIVSESVTVITSGSTIFGNSSDDTHLFTGSVRLDDELIVRQSNINNEIKLDLSTGILAKGTAGSITASNDISASNKIYASQYFADGKRAILYHTFDNFRFGYEEDVKINIGKSNNPIKFNGNITSSGFITASGAIHTDGNISSSATIIANALDISGNVDIDGTLEADVITVNGDNLSTVIAGTTVTNATNATHISVADNENTDENNLITFIENASATGNVGLESDGDFTYNPSTGTVSATKFDGLIDGGTF